MPFPPDGLPLQQPLIRFGEHWLPASEVWDKIDIASIVLEAIHRFNDRFPQLASPETLAAVPEVRRRLQDIQLHLPPRKDDPALAAVAVDLLASMSPEDTVEVLAENHATHLELRDLVRLAGETAYLAALHREAIAFRMNRISPEQTAQLWNEAGRPAAGGGLWSARKITDLLRAPGGPETAS